MHERRQHTDASPSTTEESRKRKPFVEPILREEADLVRDTSDITHSWS